MKQWLEERFLLHLWADQEAAKQEWQRAQSANKRLAQEVELLAKHVG